jgi:nitric oxide reductase subunit B
MDQAIVHLLIWMRMPGDTIFAVGALLFAWFVLRLWIAPRREAKRIGEAADAHG